METNCASLSVHRGAVRRGAEGAESGWEDPLRLPQVRHLAGDILLVQGR
jgi:hypothetical protein